MSDLRMRIVKKRSSHDNCDVDQSQNDSLPRNLLARQGSPVGSSEAVVSMEPEARSKRRKSGEQQEMAALRQQLSEATAPLQLQSMYANRKCTICAVIMALWAGSDLAGPQSWFCVLSNLKVWHFGS